MIGADALGRSDAARSQERRAERIHLNILVVEPERWNDVEFPNPDQVLDEERLVIGEAFLIEGMEGVVRGRAAGA